MKLCFVTTHLPPDTHFGGVVQSGQALLTAYTRILHQVTSCCVSKNPNGPQEKNPMHPSCARSRIFHRWGFAPDLARRLKPLVLEADIVSVNGIMTYPMTVAGLMCKSLGKPYVVALRGGLLPYRMAMKPWRKTLFYHAFMKSILKGASAIHATCEEERESVEALGISTPVTIVTNGANLPPNDEFYPEKLPAVIQAMPQEQRLVLFMSRLDPVKGLDLLIESWGRINTAGKRGNAVLAIAGPDEREYGKVLKTMACEHGVEHSICFLGMIDGNAKWALYHRADFFVLPSYSENFGLVVGEALACQTPVITTTGTPWTELDAWNAGLCVAPEQKEVQSALMQLLAMPRETLRNMGTCGKRLVAEHYSWDAMADKLVETYRCILNGEEVPRWGHPSSCFPPTPDSLMHRQRQ